MQSATVKLLRVPNVCQIIKLNICVYFSVQRQCAFEHFESTEQPLLKSKVHALCKAQY